jgi:hypothetical protein
MRSGLDTIKGMIVCGVQERCGLPVKKRNDIAQLTYDDITLV